MKNPFFYIHPYDSLADIEASVLLTALIMVIRYILEIFSRRSSNQTFFFVLVMVISVPYLFIDSIIGEMQLTKSKNDVYQVWAVVLVTLRYSIRATRLSGIIGKQNPLLDMMSSLWTANLLGTRTTLLKIPLWLLWSLNSFRIILGFFDTELTSSRDRRNLRLITEYMRTEHKHSPPEDCHATHMKGYKYLVWGENKQKIKSDPPEYSAQLVVTNEKEFITTNKVWEQKKGQLLGEPNESNELKDLCLAFALSKMLRRRFFGLPIHEANQKKSKELVLKGLIQNNNSDRAFQIIEAELAFLNDFFFTRCPAIFAKGFPLLRLVLSLSVIGVASYLALIFYHSSGRLAGDLSKTTNGIAVTWILLVILAMKEIWEMVTYVMSDWTKVVLISNYVQKPWWTRYPAIVASVKFLCKCKIGNRWHGILCQYNLLQSFQYIPNPFPYTWSLRFLLFNHVLRTRLPGYKGSPQITLLEEVKLAISKSLQGFCNKPEDIDKYLSTVANSLHPDLEQKIPLTSEFATETQKILVWHIATCYCEIKLAKTYQNTGTQSHYKAATALSQYSAHLLVWRSCLLPDRNLVANDIIRSTVRITRELLHSCKSWAHVLKKLDNLAKENDGVGNDDDKNDKDDNDDIVLGGDNDDDKNDKNDIGNNDDIVVDFDDDKDDKDGGRYITERRYANLLRREKRQERRESLERSRVIKDEVIKAGVKLGGSLSELLVENETCVDTKLWEFLEKFWARYLLYLAASVSPGGHKQSLSGGGEFLTHVWALLSHAGVLVENRPGSTFGSTSA